MSASLYSSSLNFTPEDAGADKAPPTPVLLDGPPRGDGRLILPNVATYSALTNVAQRLYNTYYDEALLHSRENAWRMSLDPVIWSALWLRWYPTTMLTWKIDPLDPEDPDQQAAALMHERLIRQYINVQQVSLWLLHSQWTGRSGVQMKYQWKILNGIPRQVPTLMKHVHGDKLVFGWDDSVGILVHSYAASQLPKDQVTLTPYGMAYMLSASERQQLLVHSFMPEDADFFRPEAAGSIFGNGFRGRLYWLWALKQKIWGLGVDFLEWFCQGLTAYYFESGNAAHQAEVAAWAAAGQGSRALMFPRFRDGSPGYKPIERFDASTASSDFIQHLLTEYFDKLIKIAISGQTLTADTAPTGLGSGVAQAHQGTEENIVKFDATMLEYTWTRDLLTPMYSFNSPGVPVGRWRYEVDSPNVQQMIENAETLFGMGASFDEEALLEAAGFTPPKTGATILSKMGSMQPAATEGLPVGVPEVTGQAESPGTPNG